jgi:hypothetical protein
MPYLLYDYILNKYQTLTEKQKTAHIDELITIWQQIANIQLAVPANLQWFNYQYQGMKKIYYYI